MIAAEEAIEAVLSSISITASHCQISSGSVSSRYFVFSIIEKGTVSKFWKYSPVYVDRETGKLIQASDIPAEVLDDLEFQLLEYDFKAK